MENPRTLETLEAKNPDLELLEEASEAPSFFTLSENSNGLGSIFNDQLQENGNDVKGESLAMDVKENGVSVITREDHIVVGADTGIVDNALVEDDVLGRKEDHIVVGADTGIVDNALVEDDVLGSKGIDSVKMVQVSGDNILLYVDFSGTSNEVNCTGLMTRKDKLVEAGNEELMVDSEEHKFYVGDIVWVQAKSRSWLPGKILDPSVFPEYALDGDKKNCLLVGYFCSSHAVWSFPSQLKPFHLNFDQMIGQNKARGFLGAVEKAMVDFGKSLKLEITCSCIRKEDSSASLLEHKSGRLGGFSAARFEPVKFLSQLKNLAHLVPKPGMLEFVVLQNYLSAFYCSVGHCQVPLQQLWETTYDAKNAGSGSMGGGDNDVGLAEGNSIIPYTFLLEQSDVMKNEMLQLDQNEILAKISFENRGALTSRKRKREIQYELRNSRTPFEGPDQRTCVSVESGNDNSELKIETGFDLRERKKSKYLSYPYVNVKNKVLSETRDPITSKVSHEGVNGFIGSSSADKTSAKRFKKTWYRKFVSGNDVTVYPELGNTSPAELLSELRFLAVDCMFPTERKTFGLTDWFFSRFRISAYHDESIYEMHFKNMASPKEAIVTDPCLSGNGLHEMKPTSLHLTSPRNKMQKKKKVTNSAISNTKSPSGRLDGNISLVACNLSVKESHVMASEAPETKQTSQDTKEAITIPDLNGNGAAPSLFVANGNNASSGPFLLDFQLTDPHSIKTTAEQSKKEGLNVGLPVSGETIVPPTRPNMFSFVLENKPGKKKRGRKPKVSSDHPIPMPTLNIPDLNGTSKEPSPLIKDLQESNIASPAAKPPRKRRRKKGETCLGTPNLNGTSMEASPLIKDMQESNNASPAAKPPRKRRKRKGETTLGTPTMILNYNVAGASRKSLATTLLLTFTPGVSMPSKETLIAIFNRFGTLKESELRVFNDTSSARVVFMHSEDAGEACRSLEESNPFGATLTKYHLQNDAILTTQHMERLQAPAKPSGPMPRINDVSPAKLSGSMPRSCDAPPIDFIKQNLEMMTSMLEKSGDGLSAEMKAKLESEINALMKKVSSYPGSSSSLEVSGLM